MEGLNDDKQQDNVLSTADAELVYPYYTCTFIQLID